MADLPKLRSPQQILGDLIDSFLAKVKDVDDLNRGSVVTQFFNAVAQHNFRAAADVIATIDAMSVDRAEGEALQRKARDSNVTVSPGNRATGKIDISDNSFDKIATTVFAGQPAPVAGSIKIYAVSLSDFPASGSFYIGRGTSNAEGPLLFTSVQVEAGGAYWSINLDPTTPTTKFHNLGEEITLAQGGDRDILVGTTVKTKASGSNVPLTYKTTSPATILDGEVIVKDVPIIADRVGNQYNVPRGSIVEVSGTTFDASCFNSNPLGNGEAPDDDDDIRRKIKEAEDKKHRGTNSAILASIIDTVAVDELKKVNSADILDNEDGSSTIVFDDGSGYEPIFRGIGIEEIIGNARAGTTDAQLRNFPVTSAFVETSIEGPFSIVDNSNLAVNIQGTVVVHTFQNSDFRVPSSATAFEVAASINNNSNLHFLANTSRNGTKVILYPKDRNKNDIAVQDLVSSNANDVLKFDTKTHYSLLLYKNDELLYQDGIVASLNSLLKSAWPITIVPGDTLSYQVDGTPEVTVTFNTSDFQAVDLAATVSNLTAIETWVEVFNNLMPGVEAIINGEVVTFNSARGADDRASLRITGGTLAAKIFSSGVLFSQGRSSDYELNKQTGQIFFKEALAEGDSISAGSPFTRAKILTNDIPSGPAEAGDVWMIVDGDSESVRNDLQSSSLTTFSKSGSKITIQSTNQSFDPIGYDNAQVGDWVLVWTEADDSVDFPIMYDYKGFWRIESVKTGEIVVDDGSTVRGAGGTEIIPPDRLVIVRSSAPMQHLAFTVGSIAGFANEVVDQLVGVDAEIVGAAVRVSTLTSSEYGQIFIAAASDPARSIGFESGAVSNTIPSHSAFIVTEDSELGMPSFTHSRFSAVPSDTTPEDIQYLDRGGSEDDFIVLLNKYDSSTDLKFLEDSNKDRRIFVRKFDEPNGQIVIKPKNFLLSDASPVQEGDRYFLRTSYQFDADDKLSVTIDGNLTTGVYSLPVSRTLTVSSHSTPTTIGFSASDGESSLALNNSSSFSGFDFEDFKVWRKASNTLTDGNYYIKIFNSDYGPSGNSVAVGIKYPQAITNTEITHSTSNTENVEVAIHLPVATARVANWDGSSSFITTVTNSGIKASAFIDINNAVSGFAAGDKITIAGIDLEYNQHWTTDSPATDEGTAANIATAISLHPALTGIVELDNVAGSIIYIRAAVPGLEGNSLVVSKTDSGFGNFALNGTGAASVNLAGGLPASKDFATFEWKVGTEPDFLTAGVAVGDIAIISSSSDFKLENRGISAKVSNVTATSFTVELPAGTVLSDDSNQFSTMINENGIVTIDTINPHNIEVGDRIGFYDTAITTGSTAPLNNTYFPEILSPTKIQVEAPVGTPGGDILSGSHGANVITIDATAHGLFPGNVILIGDVNTGGYNGLAVVKSVPNVNQFSYIRLGSSSPIPGGRYDFQSYGPGPVSHNVISMLKDNNGITWAKTTDGIVTLTTLTPHELSPNDVFEVAGIDITEYSIKNERQIINLSAAPEKGSFTLNFEDAAANAKSVVITYDESGATIASDMNSQAPATTGILVSKSNDNKNIYIEWSGSQGGVDIPQVTISGNTLAIKGVNEIQRLLWGPKVPTYPFPNHIPGNTYQANSYVKFGNKVYKNTSTTSVTPPNAPWTEVIDGLYTITHSANTTSFLPLDSESDVKAALDVLPSIDTVLISGTASQGGAWEGAVYIEFTGTSGATNQPQVTVNNQTFYEITNDDFVWTSNQLGSTFDRRTVIDYNVGQIRVEPVVYNSVNVGDWLVFHENTAPVNESGTVLVVTSKLGIDNTWLQVNSLTTVNLSDLFNLKFRIYRHTSVSVNTQRQGSPDVAVSASIFTEQEGGGIPPSPKGTIVREGSTLYRALVNGATGVPSATPAQWEAVSSGFFDGKFTVNSVIDPFTFTYAHDQVEGISSGTGGTVTKHIAQGFIARSIGSSSSQLSFAQVSASAQDIVDYINSDMADLLSAKVVSPASGSEIVDTSTEDNDAASNYIYGEVSAVRRIKGSRIIEVTVNINIPAGSHINLALSPATYDGSYSVLKTEQVSVSVYKITLQSSIVPEVTEEITVSGTISGSTPYLALRDGENSVDFHDLDALIGVPQFSTKKTWDTPPEIGESLKLVATNTDQLSRFWNRLVVTGLSNVAAIDNSKYGEQIQIESDRIGGTSQIQVNGGNANSKNAALVGSGSELNNVGTFDIPYDLRKGLNQKSWVSIENTVRQNKVINFSESTELKVYGNGIEIISGAGSFQTIRPVTHTKRTKFIVEKHGAFTAIIAVDGPLPNITSAGVKEGDWVKIKNTSASAYNGASTYFVDDRVSFAGLTWTAIAASSPINQVSPISDDWNVETNYIIDDTVSFEGRAYRALANNIGVRPNENTAIWEKVWEVQEWNSSNTGIFRVVRVFGEDSFWIENSNTTEETLTIGDAANLSFYSHDSIMPGDTLVITGNILNSNNIGRYTVLDENTLSYSFPTSTRIYTETIPVPSVSNITLGTSFGQVFIEESSPIKLYKQILSIGPGDVGLAKVIVNSPELMNRFTESLGAFITTQGKMQYSLTASVGLDSYLYYRGLIAHINKIVYGDPTDPTNFPGVRASGSDIDIMAALIKRISISLSVRVKKGIPFSLIRDQIKATVAGYVRSLGVGESVVLSKVIEAVQKVNGVDSVIITSPTYTLTSDKISVSPDQKALVVEPTTDINVDILST